MRPSPHRRSGRAAGRRDRRTAPAACSARSRWRGTRQTGGRRRSQCRRRPWCPPRALWRRRLRRGSAQVRTGPRRRRRGPRSAPLPHGRGGVARGVSLAAGVLHVGVALPDAAADQAVEPQILPLVRARDGLVRPYRTERRRLARDAVGKEWRPETDWVEEVEEIEEEETRDASGADDLLPHEGPHVRAEGAEVAVGRVHLAPLGRTHLFDLNGAPRLRAHVRTEPLGIHARTLRGGLHEAVEFPRPGLILRHERPHLGLNGPRLLLELLAPLLEHFALEHDTLDRERLQLLQLRGSLRLLGPSAGNDEEPEQREYGGLHEPLPGVV